MPRGAAKLTNQEIEQRINPYGYYLTPKTKYVNQKTPMLVYDAQLGKNVVLSLKQIKYRIDKQQRSGFDIFNILAVPEEQQQPQQQVQQLQPAGYYRFVNKLQKYNKFSTLTDDEKSIAYNTYQDICRRLGRKKNFNLRFADAKQINLNPDLFLFTFLEALQTIKRKMNKRIKLKVSDNDGTVHYYELSYDTIDYFQGLLQDKQQQEINTSENDLFESQNNWSSVKIIFCDKVKAGGFFPFINKLKSLNLSDYGIYNEINYNNYKNNCFIDALANSHKFTTEQINLIKSSVYTRLITFDYIQKMADLMHCNITIRIPNEQDNKTSAKIYKCKEQSDLNIVMFIYYDHFMINNELYVQEYYVKNHKEIDAKYPNDPTRFDIVDENGTKKHQKMTIVRLIKTLRKYDLLEEISEKEQLSICRQYEHFRYVPTTLTDEYFRSIVIKDKSDKQQDLLNDILNNDGYFMFGQHIKDKEELNKLYDDLQNIINGLGVRVRARNYTKFAELMNKIMFEYGCFENVYELAQPMANVIREQLVFPKPHTTDGEKFYSNKKLYYVDLNSAYLSVIEGIPEGKCDVNGNFSGKLNTKIKDLIHKLYNIRQSIKTTNPTLSKCLKLLSTSCWGSSIKRNRMFKTTKPRDKEAFVNSHINYIIEHGDDVVRMIKSISFQYSYPQFAREVLTNYNNKMEEIRKLCTIYYENIDAILIDEDDYNKLVGLGLVGNELGKFKIEHIFTEIAIMSSRKFVATLDNGEHLIHCPKKDIDYNAFIETVKNNKYTTRLTV